MSEKNIDIGLILVAITGLAALLTVVNLALKGLGAPFAIALSNWLIKWSVIGGSAIIGAFGSAFLSLLILIFLWGGVDSASVGLICGFAIGFLAGGGVAMWFLSKQIPIWMVIVVSILVAFLTSSLLTAVLGLLMLM